MFPEISVIMPVYNEKQNLKKSIESVLNQTYKNFELLIINEEKTNDGSDEIILQYAANDKRIRFIQKKKGESGIACSRNMGMKQSKGKYIAFLDADDYAYPLRFEKQIYFLDKYPHISLCSSFAKIIYPNHSATLTGLVKSEEISASLLFCNEIINPSVMFRKKIFLRNNWMFKTDCLIEDYELWNRIAGKINFYKIEESLIDYYFGFGNNITIIKKDEIRSQYISIVKKSLQEKLQVDVLKYPNDIFENNPLRKKLNKQFVLDKFKLLCEVEKCNLKIRLFNKEAMNKILCIQWNMMVTQCSLNFANHKLLFTLNEECCDSFFSVVDKKIKAYGNLEQYLLYTMRRLRLAVKNMEKIIIFGTGEVCSQYLLGANSLNIIAFCDNDIKKQGEIFDGKKIVAPNSLKYLQYDYILVAVEHYYDNIYQQLVNEYGVSSRKIASIGILNFL